MVYGMAWQCNALHGIWYGLEGMAWNMAWPGVHCIVYGMALRAWHRFVGMECYMVWSGGHTMVYGTHTWSG